MILSYAGKGAQRSGTGYEYRTVIVEGGRMTPDLPISANAIRNVSSSSPVSSLSFPVMKKSSRPKDDDDPAMTRPIQGG